MQAFLITASQALALLLLGLLVGSMFGIWRGYPVIEYSPATFIEVHKGAVRGLNTLLPAIALASLALVALLAVFDRQGPFVLWLYILAAAMIVAGGLITRLINQPINAEVMVWTDATLPAGWTTIRDRWWTWHEARLAVTFIAEIAVIAAILLGRRT